MQYLVKKLSEFPFWYNLLRKVLNGGIFIKEIANALNAREDEKVCDICCGTGTYSLIVEGEYIGVDLNERYIDYATKKYGSKKKKFINANVKSIDFEKKYFDKAMMINATHHFSDEENLKIFQKVNHFVRNEFIIVDINLDASNFFQKALLHLDRGRFIRSLAKQRALVSKIFKIESVFLFTTKTKSASLCLIKCKIT